MLPIVCDNEWSLCFRTSDYWNQFVERASFAKDFAQAYIYVHSINNYAVCLYDLTKDEPWRCVIYRLDSTDVIIVCDTFEKVNDYVKSHFPPQKIVSSYPLASTVDGNNTAYQNLYSGK